MEIKSFIAIACLFAVKVNGQATLDQVYAGATANAAILANVKNNLIPAVITQIAGIDDIIGEIKLQVTLLQASDAEIYTKVESLAGTTSDTNGRTNHIESFLNQISGKIDPLTSSVNNVNDQTDEIKKSLDSAKGNVEVTQNNFGNIDFDVGQLTTISNGIVVTNPDGNIDSAVAAASVLRRLLSQRGK